MSVLMFLILCYLRYAHAITQHCHGDRCYWVSDAAEGTWSQGRTACQSEGGDLAVMETEELFDYAVSAFRLVAFLSFLPSTILTTDFKKELKLYGVSCLILFHTVLTN